MVVIHVAAFGVGFAVGDALASIVVAVICFASRNSKLNANIAKYSVMYLYLLDDSHVLYSTDWLL